MDRKNCERCKERKATLHCNGHYLCEKCLNELLQKRKTINISNNNINNSIINFK
jgi:hypothetical protein